MQYIPDGKRIAWRGSLPALRLEAAKEILIMATWKTLALASLAVIPLTAKSPAAMAVTVVGVPVGGYGESVVVGVVSLNVISYYLPLGPGSTGGTYGVGEGGTLGENSIVTPGPIFGNGAPLDMWIYFGGNLSTNAQADLLLSFEDLDLDGVNDPSSSLVTLLESVEILDQSGASLTFIDEITDIGASGNSSSQSIALDLTDAGVTVTEDFWVRLRLQSFLDYRLMLPVTTPRDEVLALLTTVAVPEPTTALLLATGLAGLAVRRRRLH